MYEEYSRQRDFQTNPRRTRQSTASRATTKSTYPRRLLNQTVFSLALLSGVYLCTSSASDTAKNASDYIKSALEYKMDISGIKNAAAELFELTVKTRK